MADDVSEFQFGNLRAAWLEAFVQTVSLGKRTAVAEEMGVRQGTISKYIASLEKWYGGGPRRPLMLDNMWPPKLTEEGEAFLPKAQRALELLKELRRHPAVSEAPPRSPIDPKTIKVPKV